MHLYRHSYPPYRHQSVFMTLHSKHSVYTTSSDKHCDRYSISNYLGPELHGEMYKTLFSDGFLSYASFFDNHFRALYMFE